MDLDVLLFAGLREAIGKDRLRVSLPDGARVRDLLERLARESPALAARRYLVAVNLSVAAGDHLLESGDEVALLPPVGGGSTDDLIEITEGAIDVANLLSFVNHPGAGGVNLFLGTARDVHEGKSVASLAYEAYRPMAIEVLRELARETRELFPTVKRVALVHRLGVVPIGEASVAVAVSAPHRDESFKACRHAIDALKQRAPIWKKEELRDGGARWVENAPS